MNRRVSVAICTCLLMLLAVAADGGERVYNFRLADAPQPGATNEQSVVGVPLHHTVKQGETLLDIARHYDLGINELMDLYPELDPWIPHQGLELVIPCRWVLPAVRPEGLVINIPELRLYQFEAGAGRVRTYPIGIGDEGWHTPLGTFRIGSKREHPTWYIPPSLQEKYGVKTMAPGPENPLGDYYMALGGTRYGIHGTNVALVRGPPGDARLYPSVSGGHPGAVLPGGCRHAGAYHLCAGKTGHAGRQGFRGSPPGHLRTGAQPGALGGASGRGARSGRRDRLRRSEFGAGIAGWVAAGHHALIPRLIRCPLIRRFQERF